ncbi:MAG TPA: DUF998 domain-containing protein, partial [Gemmatimonadaceae bacterium]|nr:DUF998 domain-containing protein [Gemmatimonadaceae bacterium]
MTSSGQADATATNRLLGLGVLAGPIYLVVGIAQGLLRDGFVFARHPLSVLANGPGGWVQTANFVVTGLMVVATAIGFRRALAPRSRAVSLFLGAFGASMLVAAVFRADAMDGFPVGTPNGPPTTISTTGLVHFAAGGLGFISLAVSCLVAAWVMSRRNVPSLARLSLLAGIIILLGFFSGMVIPGSSPVLGIWIAVVVGWAWLAVMSRHLMGAGDWGLGTRPGGH